jgi:phage regulator Rha-like protein
MFQLSIQEVRNLRSQNATSRSRHGGRRYLPYAFTEHGAIMAANVLNTHRAIELSVYVVRAFVRLREMIASNKELSRRLDELEKQYDSKFKVVFDAIRELMTPPPAPHRRIGFGRDESK